MAPVGQSLLERLDATLPAGDIRVRRQAVFEEVESPARPQNPPDLGQGLFDIGDRAQRESRQGPVAAGVVERYGFAAKADVLDADLGVGDSSFGEAARRGCGLDRVDECDLCRVRGHVEPGSESDLDDGSEQPCRHVFAPPVQLGGATRPVDETRQEVLSVQTYGVTSTRPGRQIARKMGYSTPS